jgi:hypothetical protein
LPLMFGPAGSGGGGGNDSLAAHAAMGTIRRGSMRGGAYPSAIAIDMPYEPRRAGGDPRRAPPRHRVPCRVRPRAAAKPISVDRNASWCARGTVRPAAPTRGRGTAAG